MAKSGDKSNGSGYTAPTEDGLVSHFQLAPATTTNNAFKMESLKDSSNTISISSTHGQPYPKKKGGFVITSVKDNVDGDESADDLDESHTSYSDISYSRTTDVDHDPESSASEDTLNMTIQDPHHQPTLTAAPTATSVNKNVKLSNSSYTQMKESTSEVIESQASVDVEFPSELPHDQAVVKDGNLKTGTLLKPGAAGEQTGGPTLPHQQPALPTPISTKSANKDTKVVTTVQSTTILPNGNIVTSGTNVTGQNKPTTTAAPTKTLASRVYKVVKRDTQQPVKRERSRWSYFDYADSQSANIGFVSHSTSDTRLNYHDQHSHHSNSALLVSMSATSMPSSSSSYSLQHSDSASSIQRDPYTTATPINHPNTVQHSASASSINQEHESRILQRLVSADNVDDRRQSLEERSSEVSEHDAIKNVIQSYVDLSTSVDPTSEDESASSRSVRIDNKIEAAMDLVKKHLMLAVRDEVDELKDKIVELQDDNFKMKLENETLKGILTPEQFNIAQQKISSKVKNRSFLKHPAQATTLQQGSNATSGLVTPVQSVPSELFLHDNTLLQGNTPTQHPTNISLLSQPVLNSGVATNSQHMMNAQLQQNAQPLFQQTIHGQPVVSPVNSNGHPVMQHPTQQNQIPQQVFLQQNYPQQVGPHHSTNTQQHQGLTSQPLHFPNPTYPQANPLGQQPSYTLQSTGLPRQSTVPNILPRQLAPGTVLNPPYHTQPALVNTPTTTEFDQTSDGTVDTRTPLS
uniref:TSC22 domain family protein 1 n=1 Tax=Ciona intestinalis TaxID=7719 RepID=F6ZB59_CIOIN